MYSDIGIDLGSENTVIYSQKKGVLLCEPSVAAYNKKTGKIISFGKEACKILGRENKNINLIRPINAGKIRDVRFVECMLKHFMTKINGNTFTKPAAVICVPSSATEIEAVAVSQTAMYSGARKVYLIKYPMADLIGLGIDVSLPQGNMIIDVGGGKTDIAVVSLGGVVSSVSVSTAGNKIDNAIINYLSEKFRFLIGANAAESIKKNFCNLYCPDKNRKMIINGKNILSGMPDKLEINEWDVYEAVYDCIGFIADCAKGVIENLQPELVSDIIDNGIYLTGGCAGIRGLSECLTSLLRVKCHAEKNVFYCAARGASLAFGKAAYLNDGFTRISMYNNSYSNCFHGL